MIIRRLSPAIWLCFGLAAHAQSAQPADAAQAAAAIARDIAATSLTPATALTTVQAGMNLHSVISGGGPLGTVIPPAEKSASTGYAQAGQATPPHVQMPGVQGLALEAGTGRIVSLDAPAASVFAADPRVAEVRPASPTSLFVLGVAPGRTTVAAIGDNGAAIAQYDVIVQPSSYAAAQAASAIGKLLPGRDVQVAARPNGLVVSGTLRTAGEADEAVQT
ncbi:MAG: pilus assembly protein N-terminal domain-containing protein, partial [Acetobacteraceae bacterium]